MVFIGDGAHPLPDILNVGGAMYTEKTPSLDGEFAAREFEIDRNRAEIPRTVLLKAMRTSGGVSVSSVSENFIFDDINAAYLDLLETPFKR